MRRVLLPLLVLAAVALPGLTPAPVAWGGSVDTDGDGCTDTQELGPNELLGGRRSPSSFWDFFDTPDAGNGRDRAVTLADIGRVVGRFGAAGNTGIDPLSAPGSGYHTAFDRTAAPPGSDLWDLGAPNGIVTVEDIFLSVVQFGHTCAGPSLPALPSGWPNALELGLSSGPGGAAAMAATTDYGFRYQYLAGGVNTGNGWANWNPNGAFATYYIDDSVDNGIVPVFTYYMLMQSLPGSSGGEGDANYNNLQNVSTMTAYYNDLKLFFQRAGAFPTNMVVLHVEPDLWGFMQQRATNDDATTVPAKVAATGLSDLAGLPDSFSGFARAIDRLRDLYAPNVVLAYHLSIWGTGNDITYSDPPDATVDALATRSANFHNSLQSGFDIAFAEFSDRDSGFKQYQYGDGGASWFNANDFGRHVRYMSKFREVAGKRIVLWQVPQGNTRMRAMNNTWNHYQDNRPEWLLDDPTRAHLNDYVNAGVVAFLFGRGANGATCACDANGDGVTNPAPINGNDLMSLSADDDGGFFTQKAQLYYTTGAMALP